MQFCGAESQHGLTGLQLDGRRPVFLSGGCGRTCFLAFSSFQRLLIPTHSPFLCLPPQPRLSVSKPSSPSLSPLTPLGKALRLTELMWSSCTHPDNPGDLPHLQADLCHVCQALCPARPHIHRLQGPGWGLLCLPHLPSTYFGLNLLYFF